MSVSVLELPTNICRRGLHGWEVKLRLADKRWYNKGALAGAPLILAKFLKYQLFEVESWKCSYVNI